MSQNLPMSIWALGFVSLLMDISSEMVHSLLPLFLVGSLGASTVTLGVIEGLAESTALIVKVFSGAISDYVGKRKPLAIIGYGLGALSKPLFAIATSTGFVLFARLADRIGKGTRGAPRDALIADITPPEQRGAAYGLRQSLDTIGAFVGPLIAAGLMLLWANDFRAIFWVSMIPGLLAVLLLIVGVKEPTHQQKVNAQANSSSVSMRPAVRSKHPIQISNLKKLNRDYWWVVLLGAVFMLARFSEAFLVLKAQNVGLQLAFIPLVMVVMNIVYAASAYPFGKLSDNHSPIQLLSLSVVTLFSADLLLAFAQHWLLLMAGICLWGLHLGISQGLLNKMVADTAPVDLRGTSFGFFSLISGLALLLASVVAGVIWQLYGATFTFLSGAAFSLLLLLLIALRHRSITS